MWEVCISPFGRVRFRDFFLAEMLTSLIQTLSDFAVMIYYLMEITDIERQEEDSNNIHGIFVWNSIVFIAPYWWRMWQSVNKKFYDGKNIHLVNAGKYLSKILPTIILLYQSELLLKINDDNFWVWFGLQIFATLYCLIWDYYIDWGLFRSENPKKYMLREKLKFHPKFYYFAIVENFLLRFFWLIFLINFKYNTSLGHYAEKLSLVVFFAMMAEILRRTIWSIIRVENEFYNNYEQYRTIPIIPNMMDEVDMNFAK